MEPQREPSQAERELRDWLIDVKACFGTEAGRRVFQKLWERYALQPIAPHVGVNNPLSLAHIGGQKELLLVLRADLEANVEERMKVFEPVQSITEEFENV